MAVAQEENKPDEDEFRNQDRNDNNNRYQNGPTTSGMTGSKMMYNTSQMHYKTTLSILDWITVISCYISSSVCSAGFLILLMICASTTTIYNAITDKQSVPKVSSNLNKEEQRLKLDLQYYVRLSGLDLTENHITTTDGFNLVIHRVVDKNETEEQRAKRYPILLLHGLMQSSASFATSGNDSLAMYLFRIGYDVWLGNNRCGFTPSHIQYSRYNIHMWQWGIKEMGSIDVPCMIDCILNHSISDKIALVAHSQGTTQMFYSLARDCHPEIGNKLSSFTALSPAVYTGPLLNRWYLKFIQMIPRTGYRIFFGHHSFIGLMIVFHAIMPESVYTFFGYIMFNYLLGWNDSLWNQSFRARHFLFSPVYVSADLMFWWLGKNGFANYGCIFNESVDHWFDREQFPPLAIFAPGKDNLVDPYALINRLTNYEQLKEFKVWDLPAYSHLDVLWAADVVEKVGRPLGQFIWEQVDDKENWQLRDELD